MVKLVWTELSLDDLKDVFDYIAEDSKRYAEITVRKINLRAQDIVNNLHIGRIVPEIKDQNIRELISGNYRIVYRIVDEKQADILRISHSSRDLKRMSLK